VREILPHRRQLQRRLAALQAADVQALRLLPMWWPRCTVSPSTCA
jgi:hypothetical protein